MARNIIAEINRSARGGRNNIMRVINRSGRSPSAKSPRRHLPVRPPIRPLPPKRYLPVRPQPPEWFPPKRYQPLPRPKPLPAKLKKPTKMYVGVTPPKRISKQPHKFVGGLKPSFKLKLPVKKKKKVKR